MTARQFTFNPSTITVPVGTRLNLEITSIDVTHGFFINEFGVSEILTPGVTTTVDFVADTVGTFNYICSVQCGSGHTGMGGVLIVTS
jgi:cytochrome c oxidase subunit 2